MKNEPIRHHYIPQFILRNFCFDDNNNLYYYDRESNTVSVKKTQYVFMERNLYRDEINSPEEKTKIETDLAKYESEVAKIINERFLHGNDIYLTLEEDEKLKLFFAIMGFRNENAYRLFDGNITEESKVFYLKYQRDGNFNDFWKRNLGQLANCRSLKDVFDNPLIDEPIKAFMARDTYNLAGKYFVVVEKRGDRDFVIGNSYPTGITGYDDEKKGLVLLMFEIFPLSPNRVLLFAANGVDNAPKVASRLRYDIFRRPILNEQTGKIRIHVKKIYKNDVDFINEAIVNNSKIGFAFRDKSHINLE